MERILIKRAKELRVTLLVILSILTIYVLWKNFQDLPPIVRVNYSAIIGCLFFYSFYLIIASSRYLILLREFDLKDIDWKNWFKLYVSGRFISKFIPQGGNIYRGIALKSSKNFPYEQYLVSLVIFSWMDTILNLFLCLILLFLFNPTIMLGSFQATRIIITISLLICCLTPFLINYIIKRFNNNSVIFKKLENISSKILINSLKNLKTSSVVKILLLGILSVWVTVGTFYFAFIFLGLSKEIDIIKILIYVCFIRTSSVLRITPGNFGVQELLFGILTEATGNGVGTGITVSLIIRTITYITLGSFSLIFSIKSILIRKDITKYVNR